jgi:hypothetical protein
MRRYASPLLALMSMGFLAFSLGGWLAGTHRVASFMDNLMASEKKIGQNGNGFCTCGCGASANACKCGGDPGRTMPRGSMAPQKR